MRLSMTYKAYAKSSKEKTDNIITFTHFEEGNLLSGTREDAESNGESIVISDNNSFILPLLSLEESKCVGFWR